MFPEGPFVAIALLLLGGVLAGIAIEKLRAKWRLRAWLKRNRCTWKSQTATQRVTMESRGNRWHPPTRYTDAVDQLRIVMGASFTMQPLLNRSEVRVLKELESIAEQCNPSWQVMAQVSLGEILRSEDASAFSCINSKRVDLLLIDENCLPRHAIEYQGWGHYQSKAAARDAVKKEALRRAGIGYHEVVAGLTTPSDLRRLVEKLVVRPAAPR